MEEHSFTCPHCWQHISMLLDSTVNSQEYIEDCEVCCNPIQVSVGFLQGELINFQIKSIEQ
ncbi:MAG: CPXCG motif-containing cysteine-rich protein [Flavobacteriaceae bacterium]|nr:MAG: CPXCG motif-containing cysteine-rich protein [Flavobacteriaceae bacterium]